MKLCINCKHYVAGRGMPIGFYPSVVPERCAAKISPVNGVAIGVPRAMRGEGGSCGPGAALFEQRPPPGQIVQIKRIEPDPRPWWRFWA